MATAQVQRASGDQRDVTLATQPPQVTHEHSTPRALVVVLAFTVVILVGIALDLVLLANPELLSRAAADLQHAPSGALLGLLVVLLAVAIPGGRWEVGQLRETRLRRVRARRIAELSPLAGLLHVSPLALDRITVKTLHDLSPTAFELAMGDLLKLYKYRDVRHTGGARDLCVDLAAITPDGKRAVVQCKRYGARNHVGSREVQQFIGMVTVHHKVPRGLYITTSSYTQEACDLAAQHRDLLELWDGEQLVAKVRALAVK